MRRIGDIREQAKAYRFVNYLAAQGVRGELRYDESSGYTVYVYDDKDLARTERAYQLLETDPEAPLFKSYDGAGIPSDWRHDDEEFTPIRVAAREDIADEDDGSWAWTDRLVTFTVLGLCLALTLLAKDKSFAGLLDHLYISNRLDGFLVEVRQGQIWRLFTPILLHGGFLHLIFNLMWHYDLGSQIEEIEGSFYALMFILVTALLCNVSQYLMSGPMFVGLSGVIYAELGYVWMQSRYKLGTNYAIAEQVVVFMLGWLVICAIGLIPNVANTQHVVGLISGAGFGYLRSGDLTRRWRRRKYKKSQESE